MKSGFKESTSGDSEIGSVIDIAFDLKKDLAIELLPQTTYTYTIYVRIDSVKRGKQKSVVVKYKKAKNAKKYQI